MADESYILRISVLDSVFTTATASFVYCLFVGCCIMYLLSGYNYFFLGLLTHIYQSLPSLNTHKQINAEI